jgi:hypothetical protein
VLGEDRDVADALAQGGQLDLDDVDAVVEVLAELARRDELLEGLVAGEDDAHVDLDGLRAAHGLELAFLEDAQQLELHAGRGGVDLVEEDRPAVGREEAADLVGVRAGEGALDVPEELALQQRLGDAAAGDLDVGLLAARRVVWIAWAIRLLPVPLSPVIRTVVRLGATASTSS